MSNNKDKSIIMLGVSETELANKVGQELKAYITDLHNKILLEKKEEVDRPLNSREAMEWLSIGRTAFSKMIKEGKLAYTPLNPDHKGNKSQKYFMKKDLIDYIKKNRVRAIDELKNSSNG